MMAIAEICSECSRPLVDSNGAVICTWRLCGEFGRDVSGDSEQMAFRAEARQRLAELKRVRAVLWPDRDDCAEVLSELVVIQGQIRQAEQALR